MVTILGLIGGIGIGGGLITALVLALRGWRKEQGDNDEAFAKVMKLKDLELDLSQVRAARDEAIKNYNIAKEETEREKIARELAEGHVNDLLTAIEKNDPNGRNIAASVKLSLRTLAQLSGKRRDNPK